MPAKILLSAVKALDFDFPAAVVAYKQAIAEFAARPADWDPVPAPMPPHPLVALAASVDAFEIHDDTPPPPAPPSLEYRKAEKRYQIEQLGQAVIDKILPPMKRPLMDMELRAAARTPEKDRSEAQRTVINNRRGIDEQEETIRYKVAKVLSTIHDMDEETFSAFERAQLPAFE